jgi:hypothetical protein
VWRFSRDCLSWEVHGLAALGDEFGVFTDEHLQSPLRSTSVSAGQVGGKLGAEPRQLGLDGGRLDDLDHRAPAGEMPGDVQRRRCGEPQRARAWSSSPSVWQCRPNWPRRTGTNLASTSTVAHSNIRGSLTMT